MATTYTPSLRLAQMQTGDPQVRDNWGTIWNATVAAIDQAIAGVSVIDLTGKVALTLTTASNAPDQARSILYNFIGALTSNCVITIPSEPKVGWAVNNTTGGFYLALTVAGATQTILLPPARIMFFTCDGTSVSIPQPFFPSPLMSSGPASPAIMGNAGSSRALFFWTAQKNRWALGADAIAESGGNAGSNWSLWRYTDTGALIDSPFSVNRATGQTQVASLASSGKITAPNGEANTQVVNFSQFSPTVLTSSTGNEITYALPGGKVIVKHGTISVTLVNDGVGNAIATIDYLTPFPNGVYSVSPTNGAATASSSGVVTRTFSSRTFFDVVLPSGVIGQTVRINWTATGH